jgi:transposase-like protein
MTTIRSMLANQSSVAEPERRGDERSEAPRSGGSATFERADVPVLPDSEVPARPARRRFTTAYKLEILRKADACTQHGERGALLRKEGLYSSHLITWRQQRERGLTPKKRGRKAVPVDPRVKKTRAGESAPHDAAAEGGSAARFPKKLSGSASAALPGGPETPSASIVAAPRGEWPFAFW